MKLPTKPLMCALACAALGASMPGTALAVTPASTSPGGQATSGATPARTSRGLRATSVGRARAWTPGSTSPDRRATSGATPASINLGPRATSDATRASTSPARRGTAGVFADRGRRWKDQQDERRPCQLCSAAVENGEAHARLRQPLQDARRRAGFEPRAAASAVQAEDLRRAAREGDAGRDLGHRLPLLRLGPRPLGHGARRVAGRGESDPRPADRSAAGQAPRPRPRPSCSRSTTRNTWSSSIRQR